MTLCSHRSCLIASVVFVIFNVLFSVSIVATFIVAPTFIVCVILVIADTHILISITIKFIIMA